MPRPTRISRGGLIHHVLHRGPRGERIFRVDADYAVLETVLADALSRTGVRIHGWCLLPDRWHLVLEPPAEASLAAVVREIALRHARLRPKEPARVGTGHLHDGSYRSYPVQDGIPLLDVLALVESGPWRARLVSDPLAWPWSSGRLDAWRRLGIEPPARPVDWPLRLSTPIAAETLRRLRDCATYARAYGERDWVRRIAPRRESGATPLPAGEPAAPVEPLRPRGVGRGRGETRPRVRRPERGPGRDKPGA
jgi:putative transposase